MAENFLIIRLRSKNPSVLSHAHSGPRVIALITLFLRSSLMSKSLNLATMLAVAGGLTMAIAPTAASATCAPISRSSCGACSAKPKKAKKVTAAKAGCCAAAPCAAKKGCCAATASTCAPKAGCCAAKCSPKA